MRKATVGTTPSGSLHVRGRLDFAISTSTVPTVYGPVCAGRDEARFGRKDMMDL